MSWIRQSDDVVHDLRTSEAARHLGPNGIGRVVAMLTEVLGHCNRNLTDGRIEPQYAARFLTDRRPLDVLAVMAMRLSTGEPGWLMGNAADGFAVVDYHATQPTRATVLARRVKDARRKAESRAADVATIAEAQRLLTALVAREFNALPAIDQVRVRTTRNLDFLEHVKRIAARAGLSYDSTRMHVAMDAVFGRAGGR